MLALLLLQAVAGPPLPPELRKRAPRVAMPCPTAGDGGEIVVCGRPTDQRLETLREQPTAAPLTDRMTFRLPGGGTGNVHAFQRDMPGATSQGVAVTLKVPFGRKPKPAEVTD